jgi:hypothetical protein
MPAARATTVAFAGAESDGRNGNSNLTLVIEANIVIGFHDRRRANRSGMAKRVAS